MFDFNVLKKFKQKHYNTGYENGHTKGYEQGAIDGANYVIEQYGLKTTANKPTKEPNNTPVSKPLAQQNLIQINDEIMLWANNVLEIADSKFFKTTMFKDANSKQIKNLVDYIDYLSHTHEVKLQYPMTYPHLSTLKQALEQVYENKLLTEEAEGF